MPKRLRSQAPPSTQKTKRARVGQSSLDYYFSASPNKIHKAPATSHVGTAPEPGPSGSKTEVIDVDAFNLDQPEELESIPSPSVKPGGGAANGKVIGFNMAVSAVHETHNVCLSSDPLLFSTSHKPWSTARTPYSFLAQVFTILSDTRSRIIIINTLTNALRTITIHDRSSLVPSLYLLSNTLSPPYSPIELGLGPSVISKAIQHVSGLSSAALKQLYNGVGDLGDVAFAAKSQVRTLIPHPPLLIPGVYNTLIKIANVKGQGAAKQKQALVEKLLVSAKGEEMRYLVRTLSMNLRVGAVRTSILTALARAMVLSPGGDGSVLHAPASLIVQVKPLPDNNKGKTTQPARDEILAMFSTADSLLKKVFVLHPNYNDIANGLLEGGLDGLEARVHLSLGIPLHPTLGTPARSLDEVYERIGDTPFTAEFKYDGQRAQIHGERGLDGRISVWIFSRHLEDMTSKYPDVVRLAEQNLLLEQSSFIIDAEITAIDPLDGKVKPFQDLANRARKDVELADVKVAVCVFAFDIMYLNGESLLDQTLRHRRQLLRTRFPPIIPNQKQLARFAHVESCESEGGREAVESFWAKAIESRSEGLMIKILDNAIGSDASATSTKRRKILASARYEADKRTSAWSKLKKDYVTGLGDSLDLIPIGAWYGNGRKAGWWSPILLGLRNDNGQVAAVCKCMSGFTDNFYKSLAERYSLNLGSEHCAVDPLWGGEFGGYKPDVYFRPGEVWEIRGADITLSPTSLAALGRISSSRGLSLRFPRFIRVREEKNLEQASDAEFLAQIYKSQQAKGGDKGLDEGDLLDVDFEEEVLEEEEDSEE